MNEERFNLLLDHYVTGNIQEPEQQEFFALLEDPAYRNMLEKKLEQEWQEGQYEENGNASIGRLIEQYVLNRINNEAGAPVVTMQPDRVFNWRRIATVAAVLVVLAGAAYYIITSTISEPAGIDINLSKTDAAPGGNKAVLTLSNGKQVILDSLQNGIIAQQGSVEINKQQNGKLTYSQDSKETQTVYNTVSTPRGGQYQVQLSDGTWVWLNAASSLRFPAAFTGKERVVEITGEAYFEVAHDAAHPFKVLTNGTGIEVLGTHFNVNAYTDENAIRTTLLEGAVRLTRNAERITLKPGEQGIAATHSPLTIQHSPDIEEILAWKNGLFRFNNADIETVMKQVERWYDLEVVYEGPKPDGHYRGKVPRDVMASEMLRIIESSGVKCRIENKKIIIMK